MKLKGGLRTADEIDAGPKCAGVQDPITQEDIHPKDAIRLYENTHYYCFDINSLIKWTHHPNGDIKNSKNPSTNLPFSANNMRKILKKAVKNELVVFHLSRGAAEISLYSNNAHIIFNLFALKLKYSEDDKVLIIFNRLSIKFDNDFDLQSNFSFTVDDINDNTIKIIVKPERIKIIFENYCEYTHNFSIYGIGDDDGESDSIKECILKAIEYNHNIQ